MKQRPSVSVETPQPAGGRCDQVRREPPPDGGGVLIQTYCLAPAFFWERNVFPVSVEGLYVALYLNVEAMACE